MCAIRQPLSQSSHRILRSAHKAPWCPFRLNPFSPRPAPGNHQSAFSHYCFTFSTMGSYSIYNLSGWFLLLGIILLRFIHEIMYIRSSFLLLRGSSLYECTTIDSIRSWWAFGFWAFLFPGVGYYEESCWKHSRTGLCVGISLHFSRGNT